MNERIQQFAEQAEIDYDLRPEIARAPVWIGTDEELEKQAKHYYPQLVIFFFSSLERTSRLVASNSFL
jgi:hypothetical protein